MLQAIIDIGSSKVRLALYYIESGQMELLLKKSRTLDLAGFMVGDALSSVGQAKLISRLNGFKKFLDSFRINRVVTFTAGQLRTAVNREEVIAAVANATGFTIRIIKPEEEAAYNFLSAVRLLPEDDGVLFSMGGTSTEIIVYENRELKKQVTIPIGPVTLHRRFASDILPLTSELAAMRKFAEAALEDSRLELGEVQTDTLAGLGGAMKGIAHLYHELQCTPLTAPMLAYRVDGLAECFCRDIEMDEDDILALLHAVPDRLTTIVAALAIVEAIIHYTEARKLIYTDSGVREGFVYKELLG